jgi:hypothetical protein
MVKALLNSKFHLLVDNQIRGIYLQRATQKSHWCNQHSLLVQQKVESFKRWTMPGSSVQIRLWTKIVIKMPIIWVSHHSIICRQARLPWKKTLLVQSAGIRDQLFSIKIEKYAIVAMDVTPVKQIPIRLHK